MRVYAIWALVAALAIYAWRDWFKALCGLVVLMAIMEHRDMPRTVMDIQGLNPWNVLMASVLVGWLVNRRREGLTWDMPRHITGLLLAYLGIILIGFARMMADRSHIEQVPTTSLISEELLNTLKWVIPGVLLFDGCRSPQRLRLAVSSLLCLYLLLALQVAREIPLISLLEQSREVAHMRLRSCDRIGYSACDTSTMLAGASWAMVACLPLCRARWAKVLIGGAALLTAYGQALTGGRAGYMAWAGIGLTLCFLKWRKFLLLAPVVPILLFALFPGAAARALQGFGETNVAGEGVTNDSKVTSGRTLIWPYVVDKIAESPAHGYGRRAMARTGLTAFLGATFGQSEAFPHPHNAYLEWLLDNGFLGMVPVALFFGIILVWSAMLFRDTDNPWCAAVGGAAFSLLLAQLLGAIGAQHFYPREGTVGMWAATFLMLRVHVERQKARAASLASGMQRRMPRLNRGSLVPSH